MRRLLPALPFIIATGLSFGEPWRKIDDVDKGPPFSGSAGPRRLESTLGSMAVTYKFRIDDNYCRTLIDRYYQQRPLPLRLTAQFGFLGLILAGAFLLLVAAPFRLKVWIALIVAALVFFGGVALTKWSVYRRLSHRADFGTEATVTMSEAGLVGSGVQAAGRWNWAAYPLAVRYSDGIMLLRRGVIRWLPDSALVIGTPADAIGLAREKSALRELA